MDLSRSAKRILVPLDFTRGSSEVVQLAAMLAGPLDAELVLLHVIEPPDSASTIVPGADVERDATTSHGASDRGLALALARAALAPGALDRVRTRTEIGDAVKVILDLVKQEEYTLIVMGTHGRTGLGRLLESSVAERVVRGARCPVLTIHLPHEGA